MVYFLLVILSVIVFSVWQSGREAVEALRDEIHILEREINWLREQLASLVKAQAARPVSAPEAPPVKPPEQVLKPVAPVKPPEPAAAHSVAPAIAAFTSSVAPTASAPVAPTPPPPRPVAPPPIQHHATPAAVSAEPAEAGKLFSLEERLGANWLNKLGISSLVIGLAFFLAVKLQTWGPVGKVLCGYAISLAMLAGGVWLERKATYRIFARAGIGGGWALAFFTTFALYHIPAAHLLNSLVVDLVLMLAVAACMVGHSLLYRSQTVTGLAFMLGFATLLTSHMEAANGTVVFSLAASAVLAVALVVVTTLRHWAVLELAGLSAVYLTHFVWLSQVLPDNHASFTAFWPSTALILLYWLIFRLAYVLRTPLDQREENLSSLTAVLNSTGVLGLLKFQSAHPEWAFWALMALGAVEMALAFSLRSRRRQAFVVLTTIAAVLLVSAVPFRFHGVSWPVLWLVEAQVLAVCGLRLGEPVFRRLGLLTGVVTGGVLAFHDVVPLLFFRLDNPDPGRHTSLIAALALAAILYWIHSELYPRRWPKITEDAREAFALRITSWLAAAAAATALWIAVPDLWLPVGWLALVLLLGLVARWFTVRRVAMEADVLALVTGAILIFHHIGPLAYFRLDNSDPSRHFAETAVLAIAALCYTIYAELYPRCLPSLAAKPEAGADFNIDLAVWQEFIMMLSSLLGTTMAAAALWVVLPAPWIVVGWLGLVLFLGLSADWLKAVRLAVQADLLAVAAILGLFTWNFFRTDSNWRSYDGPLIAAVALLYCGMRRKTVPAVSAHYVAPVYSWAATLLLAFLAADLSPELALVPVWAALGLVLFEIGRFARKGFLRWQGYFLLALGLGRFLVSDIWELSGIFGSPPRSIQYQLLVRAEYMDSFGLTQFLLFEVLFLAAAGYWLMERTRNPNRCIPPLEPVAGLAAGALGTLSIALWFAYRFPSAWVPVPGGEVWVTPIWAAMATVLLALSWLVRRRALLVQATALVFAVLGRAFFLDLVADSPTDFWHGQLFHLGITALILLAALPFAFRLRGEDRFAPASISLPAELALLLRNSRQVFFFAAFALEVVALAVKLSSGHITIAWSLLGLGVFLFALLVGERSFRLAGLLLLLVSVAKVLLMDVWQLSPSDRYTTLIVMGLALLAVSFLYTRFGEVIRRYL
jgi:uncharacterized membrane protein